MNYLEFIQNFWKFKNHSDGRFPVRWQDRHPCLHDDTLITKFDRHYIYHPAWAARILAKTKPKKHVDISSTLAFSTMVSAFIPTDFYDFRPAKIVLTDFNSNRADLMALPFKDKSVISLSCMHTIEHIGLGRYGDKLDPNGDLKAVKELIRVLALGGNLLIVVPIGKPKLFFNAHRVYSYAQISRYFLPLKLKEFTLIPDNGQVVYSATQEVANNQNYGCGWFWFHG